MQHNTLISVIMPAYNAARHIAESIETVLQQTYPHWELIITDDGSTDATPNIIKQFVQKDNRIQYIHQQNGKQGKARNTGIHAATGSLIAFLDADDLWMPHKLEQQVIFIHTTNADLVFADALLINENGEQQKNSWGVKEAQYRGEEGLLAFVEENRAPILTVLVTKNALLAVHGFSEAGNMQYVEDYDLWLRMLQNQFVFAASSEKLAAYRLHTSFSMERKKTILHVVDVLQQVQISNTALQQQKNVAFKMWMRKCIKTCLPVITSADLQKIITLFPSSGERRFFSFLNSFLKKRLLGKLILLYSRGIVKK